MAHGWRCSAKGKREAQQECARIVTELDAGTFIELDKTTVAVFLQRWLAHIKTQISAASFERYCAYANIIVPALGAVRLTKLRPEHISGMYSKTLEDGRRDGKGGLSPRTVHQAPYDAEAGTRTGVRMACDSI
jgi:hypothetical protein